MTKRYIFITSIILLIAATTALVNYFQRPSAYEVTTGMAGGASVVWGYIADSSGQPLKDIRVGIGERGEVSESDGSFIVFVNSSGRLPVTFRNSITNDQYEMTDAGESSVHIDPGESVNVNFILVKSAIQPTPIAVQPGPIETPAGLAPTATNPSSSPTPTPTLAPKPAQPTNLTAVAKQNPRQVELKWKDNANSESGFTIVRTEDKTAKVKLTDVTANTTSYNDTTAERNKTYFYKVRAFSGSGAGKSYSAYSNEKKIKAK